MMVVTVIGFLSGMVVMSVYAKKIFGSLNSLEQAIEKAKIVVGQGAGDRAQLVARLDCYLEVVRKQRVLAKSLCYYSARQDWDQVRRYTDLIRGSSCLIQLEAQAFIQELLDRRRQPEQYQA